MKTRYSEIITVTRTEPLDIQGSTGIVRATVKGKTLICFSSDFKQFASMPVNSDRTVFLSLMTWRYSVNTEQEPVKKIQSLVKPQTPNHYLISGQLIGIFPDFKSIHQSENPSQEKVNDSCYCLGIIDCGVLIGVEISAKEKPEIGNSISAEGRLDITLV